MADFPPLIPITAQDLEDTLSFALRFDGRKRTYIGDEFMAKITAQRLVKHLERCGYVVVAKPPAGDASGLMTRTREVGLKTHEGNAEEIPAPRCTDTTCQR